MGVLSVLSNFKIRTTTFLSLNKLVGQLVKFRESALGPGLPVTLHLILYEFDISFCLMVLRTGHTYTHIDGQKKERKASTLLENN